MMEPRRLLIVLGAAILVAGLCWPWLSKLGLGRMPGDIVIERQNVRIYFPVVTCIAVSVAVSLLLWLLRK